MTQIRSACVVKPGSLKLSFKLVKVIKCQYTCINLVVIELLDLIITISIAVMSSYGNRAWLNSAKSVSKLSKMADMSTKKTKFLFFVPLNLVQKYEFFIIVDLEEMLADDLFCSSIPKTNYIYCCCFRGTAFFLSSFDFMIKH